ncbi:bifunctional pyr operon transcriptional regulator/uracil phosphoribosyltransferase PyrR [Flaviaesturariibacter aridisoli]|uniref:Bifunctional protein PyrR n=1 Tax=Flaviaesturariibacter aridisoli TaxID=2545761 RepID=A0A4R4DWP4_9BACT|nr:bifunctional pyr operon transcriptional regulator/uracil phosphoribosyltransferase PyrR [Flaviaesturariibacter aridisoli]TCZ65283.1 bifunctional pyr operon transcriptional regulator/uracil phosphoribosyltransferase PyrR [Flaviaesturariibacter aridisoli]
MKSILPAGQMALTIQRLAHQLLEDPDLLSKTALIGIQPRGVFLSDRLVQELRREPGTPSFDYGKLDITFYRDDIRQGLHVPAATDIGFSIEGKRVVLVDDVLYTGRTIRAALDALMDFGRPARVELLVLINRRYSRELPVQPDYTGRHIDSIVSQKVKVLWAERDGRDEVLLLDND